MILLKKIFWAISFFVALFFVVIYFQRYLVSREWHKAHDLTITEKYQEAEVIYSNIFSKLKWNGRFLTYYGNIKLHNKKYSDAIELYEKAKFTYPRPSLFESLGSAYINYQSGITNEITHPTLKGTPLKRGIELSRGECINKAVHNWMIAGNILPWRLTSKFYLADFFYQVGDLENAVKYAKLVVETPMKRWSKRGEEFKLKSATILIELGVECADPGLIVFDINDKSTWNEGRW